MVISKKPLWISKISLCYSFVCWKWFPLAPQTLSETCLDLPHTFVTRYNLTQSNSATHINDFLDARFPGSLMQWKRFKPFYNLTVVCKNALGKNAKRDYSCRAIFKYNSENVWKYYEYWPVFQPKMLLYGCDISFYWNCICREASAQLYIILSSDYNSNAAFLMHLHSLERIDFSPLLSLWIFAQCYHCSQYLGIYILFFSLT